MGRQRRYIYRMADDGVTIRIDEALQARLEAAAEASGETFEQYVRHALEVFADSATDWDEVELICNETREAGDGIPWEDFGPRLKTLGQRRPG